MGVGKKHTAFCEPVKVWGFDVWMSTEAPDPVVQVVDGHEQDVGFVFVWAGGECRVGHCKCSCPRRGEFKELPSIHVLPHIQESVVVAITIIHFFQAHGRKYPACYLSSHIFFSSISMLDRRA